MGVSRPHPLPFYIGIPYLEASPSLELSCAGGARNNSSLQKRDVTSPDLLPSPSRETIFHHKLREPETRNLNKDSSKSKRLGPSRSVGSLAGLLPSTVGHRLLLSCSLRELDLGWGSFLWSGPACSWGWG